MSYIDLLYTENVDSGGEVLGPFWAGAEQARTSTVARFERCVEQSLEYTDHDLLTLSGEGRCMARVGLPTEEQIVYDI